MRSGRRFWALWLTILAAKCVLAARLPLFGDEAWYWLEGQHPAWAYSDLPGLTAWLARLGVETAGPTTFALRWPFIALSMIVPLLLRAAAARWFGRDAGDTAGVLALLLPLLGGLGLLAVPDVPLTLAAALCLCAALRLSGRVDALGCTVLALGLIFGALSHYRFAPLIGAGMIGLLLDTGGRRALRDARVWIAIALGALAWAPLLLWNVQHQDAGLTFQLIERHPWRLHAEGLTLPLAQLLVVTPLLLGLLVAALAHVWRAWRARELGPWGVVLGTSAVPMVLYLGLAFFADKERVSFHWLLQAYLPLVIVAPCVFARWSRTWRIATMTVAALGLAALFGYALIAMAPSLRSRWADSRWYPDNFAGWREIAERVRAHPGALVADNFMLAAQLAFALQRTDIAVLDHPLNHKHGRALQLRVWGLQASVDAAAPRLLIVEDSATSLRRRLEHYRSLCDQVGALSSPESLNLDHGRKRFLLFALPAERCVLPALAWIDVPAPGARGAPRFDVAGWAFKDGAGLARVEITLDGKPVALARYGSSRSHVATYWRISTDPAHPNVGFEATVDATGFDSGDHWLGLVLYGRDGSVEPWPEQRIRL